MNAIGLIMDVLLIALILAAVGYGMRLEKKLRALREGQGGFVKAVAELNVAGAPRPPWPSSGPPVRKRTCCTNGSWRPEP